MKKTIMFIALSLSLFIKNDCNAALVYSFEGNISSLFFDGGGIIAEHGFSVGDVVTAQFLVDFEKDGYFILNNGDIYFPSVSQITNNNFWYFNASLLNGTLLPEKNGGFNNADTDIAEYHTGYYNSGPMGNRGSLKGGYGDSNLEVWKEGYGDVRVDNWLIGENLNGTIVGWSDQNWSIMWVDMTLTNIQPVPLPSTNFLFLTVILSVVFLRRKRC